MQTKRIPFRTRRVASCTTPDEFMVAADHVFNAPFADHMGDAMYFCTNNTDPDFDLSGHGEFDDDTSMDSYSDEYVDPDRVADPSSLEDAE